MTQATKTKPIGVHALAAFVFCQRAGIIAMELPDQDSGDELGLARLDYVHPYAIVTMERRLHGSLNEILIHLAALIGLLSVFLLSADGLIKFLCLLGELAIAGRVFFLGVLAYVIYRRMRVYASYPPKEPNVNTSNDEPANWWCMRAAGYESLRPPAPFIDADVGIVGRPWRLLRKGTNVIPVFRANKPDNVRQQHRIRIAAYCHLIESRHGARSTYGIVLDPSGYAGTAIKFTKLLKEELERELSRFEAVLQRTKESGAVPPSPKNENKCKSCPYGEPKPGSTPQIATSLDGRPVTVNPLFNEEGKSFHSDCGDRFQWHPPHRHLFEKQWAT